MRYSTSKWCCGQMSLRLIFLTILIVYLGNSYAYSAEFIVTSTNDDGLGSFRQAILDANARVGMDTVSFDIPGLGPHEIQPFSEFPEITDPVIIDGYSQPGTVMNSAAVGTNAVLQIIIDGSLIKGEVNGITISAGDSTVRGLVINRFKRMSVSGHGIYLHTKGNNRIEGNFIGTDITGTAERGNGGFGIRIVGSSGNFIGGANPELLNVISDNSRGGIGIAEFAKDSNLIQGNLIGVSANGLNALGNDHYGIHIHDGTNTIIGGKEPGSANTIAFNLGPGVAIRCGTGDAILGNSIFFNDGLGIDLLDDGFTDNDSKDGDLGSVCVPKNRLQNFPEINKSEIDDQGNLILEYHVDSDPSNSEFPLTVEFFRADSGRSGEGKTLLGRDVFTKLDFNDGWKTVNLGIAENLGFLVSDKLVSTATDQNGNTSEFSPLKVPHRVLFVDHQATAGANDGTSWDHAFTDLQLALEAAEAMDESLQIWVAKGTYKPTESMDRNSTFQLQDRVALYGGFSGSENELNKRDPVNNKTILSGDLTGDDGIDFNNYEENVYHVITSDGNDSTAVLDGFMITGGNANGTSTGDHSRIGGGILTISSEADISNCLVTRNAAFHGGGIYIHRGSPRISHCVFSENEATQGGGIWSFGSDSMVHYCLFFRNEAVSGGAIHTEFSPMSLTNCIFRYNIANHYGGGIENQGNLELENCIFNGNTAFVGGGMGNVGGQETLTGCKFYRNSADFGGGMYNSWGAKTKVAQSRFIANQGESGAAIYYSFPSDTEIANSKLEYNNANQNGGGFFYGEPAFNDGSTELDPGNAIAPKIINCLFRENTAGLGDALYIESVERPSCTDGGSPCMKVDAVNSVFSGGSSKEGENALLWSGTMEAVTFGFSNIQGKDNLVGVIVSDGGGNTDTDPLLTVDGHVLNENSPLIDSGTEMDQTKEDIDSEMRPVGLLFDMGLDEFFDSDGDGLPEWLEKQAAMDLHPDGDEDHDGLTNLEEYGLSTNPSNPDSDFDGRQDGEEIIRAADSSELIKLSDPLNPDSLFSPFHPDSAMTFSHERLTVSRPVYHGQLNDIDGDGDLDLLCTFLTGKIVRYRNIGSMVNPSWGFPNPVVVDFELTPGSRAYMADVSTAVGEPGRDGVMDMVILDTNGNLRLLHHSGNHEDLSFITASTDWAGTAKFVPAFDALGDLDLDGDLDRFVGLDENRMPVFETNIDEHLVIFPRYLTLVQGESEQLEVEGDHGEVSFTLVQTSSGEDAQVTQNGEYMAGTEGTGVDVIRVVAEDGLSGLVVVNVISPDEADRNAKVLIVVGTRSVEDSLFATSERLAMDAYVVCRQRGYRASDICLLTPDGTLSKSTHLGYPIVAADDNGQLETAIKDWASDVDDLILYFVDHGVVRQEKGNLVLRPGEYLSSDTLKSWLDDWQIRKADRTSLVIIDTCYSGHFVQELALGSAQRIVMAASQPGSLAHFQGNGTISFSQLFWDEIGAGADTHKAFLATVDNLADTLDQVPTLDTNGDGEFEGTDAIGTIRSIGLLDLLGGIQRPVVGTVMDDITINEPTTTLWCSDITSSNGIQKVIAYIVPPTLQTEVEGGSALTDMASIELVDYIARSRIVKEDFEFWQTLPEEPEEDESDRPFLSKENKDLLLSSYTEIGDEYVLNDGVSMSDLQRLRTIEERLEYPPRYEADWEAFDTPGRYRILFFTEDNWGMLSTVRSALLTVEGPGKKAVIIECHGTTNVNTPWPSEEIDRQAQLARQTLHNRSFGPEDIQWFGPGHSAVNKTILEEVFTNDFVEDIDELTIYLLGNATAEGVLLTDDDMLTPLELKGWLDILQTGCSCRVTVIVEADFSGNFLSGLVNSNYERYVIASTDSEKETLRAGSLTFGDFFWGEVRRNRSIQQAFANSMLFARSYGLRPEFKLDDDGDGLYDKKKDGPASFKAFIGSLFLTGDDEIRIPDYSQRIVVNSEVSGTGWVKNVFAPDGSALEVALAVVDPDLGSVIFKEVMDASILVPGRYELTIDYSLFPNDGPYIGVIQVTSSENPALKSASAPVEITVGAPNSPGENVIDEELRRLIVNGDSLKTVLATEGIDRYRFWAWAGQAVTLDVNELSPELDLRLSVFRQTDDGSVTLAENDDWGPGLPERIWNFAIPNSGWYGVKVDSLTPLFGERRYSIQASTENLNVPDDFEPDDTVEKAQHISTADGGAQFHNLHTRDDVDWVKFWAVKNKAITINAAVETVTDIDLTLEIYDFDGTTRLETVDENGLGEGELYLFTPEIDGIYYLKVTDVDPQSFRLNTEYELTVFYETGELNGFPQGSVIDRTTNEPLPEFRIKIFSGNVTFWDFTYRCLDVAIDCDGGDEECGKYDTPGFAKGDYKMEVSSAGYEPELLAVELEANKVTCQNFSLKPENSTFIIAVDDSHELKFGQIPGATENFDIVYDEIFTLNKDGIANVYLLNRKILDPTQQILMSDFRPVKDTTRWRLQFEVLKSGNQSAELRWEFPPLDNGFRIYLQELIEELPIGKPVDMTKSSSVSVVSNSSFEIVYSQPIDEGLTLDPGWNLCSIPVMTLTTVNELAGKDEGLSGIDWHSIWYWDNDRYQVIPGGFPLNPERGYWVMNKGDIISTNDVVGIIADGFVRLHKGWNLVAPVVECPKPQKSEIIGHIWRWDRELQRYEVVRENETLTMGYGYWIYANQECELILNGLAHENSQN